MENIVDLPQELILEANYPNPFNPTTHINYTLPENTPVKLKIYNLKGELVKILVEENQSAGRYTISWNGTDIQDNIVPSGIYTYQLSTNSLTLNRRMILLK